MQFSIVLNQLGKLIIFIGLAMLFPLFWACYDHSSDIMPLLYSIGITLFCGILLTAFSSKGKLGYKESFTLVTFAWLAAILFGSLPFLLSGSFTLVDAVYESTSGFSTTGASILNDIEALPRGLLFWRQMTHWLGGMGIMILFVAIMSQSGTGSVQIFRAEYTIAFKDKMLPRIRSTAIMLWIVYVLLSLIMFIVYYILGMPLYDALCHAFSTVATGGFSTRNASIAAFNSPGLEWATTIFMFAAGINFFLFYNAFKARSLKPLWHNPEFRCYSWITVSLIAIITVLILPLYDTNIVQSLRLAAFQLVSIMTGTGYATADYNFWPTAVQLLLLLAMFLGGCAGSTTCSIKIIRWMIMVKQSVLELKKFIYPRAVFTLKIHNEPVAENLIIRSFQFFFIFTFIFALGAIALTALGLDFISALSASLSALANVGPGLGSVGPVLNYAHLPAASKYILCILMLLGRLEIYTVLVLLLPKFWSINKSAHKNSNS